MRRYGLSILLLTVVAVVAADTATSKEIVTTACGREQCRTVSGRVSGVAVLPTRVRAPSGGRFYTLTVRFTIDGKVSRWRLAYEARRCLVLAGNEATRSFLGGRWRLLAPDVRRAFSLAVRGLEPMPRPPRWAREPAARR
jgi:hypothetical protein